MIDAYYGLASENLRRLYAAACMCYDQSIPMPIGIGADIAGVPPKDMEALLENECKDILVLTRSGIRPPHRITANLVVVALPSEVKSEISLSLAKGLAPHIDGRAMRSGTREYRIARHLMNHQIVIRDAGEVGGRSWYEALRSHYDWNGRYWDQRALFESYFEQHKTARSYAERSIYVHPHSFGYNTLGTVLFRIAIRQGSVPALNDGIRHLSSAKDFRDWESREHPFTTFFTSMIRFAQAWGIHNVPQQAKNEWTNWFQEAQSSRVFSNRQSQGQLTVWQREWLRFTISA